MIDRVGKGIRGAPRDALVADVTPPDIRGAAYGLRQSLDTVGAFSARCWPCADVSLGQRFPVYFLGGGHPAVLSISCSDFGLEPKRHRHKRTNPLTRENLKKLSAAYWWVVGSAASLPSPASAKPFWCCAPSRWRSRCLPFRW
jgi:hypothetical protein